MKKFGISEIKTKVKDVATDIRTHWQTPKEGNYVPYKEVKNICLGDSGATGIHNAMKYISFNASCFLVGSIYGITFTDIYVIGIISMILSYLYNPLVFIIQDNLGKPPLKTSLLILFVSLASIAIGFGCLYIPEGYGDKILRALPQILATGFFFNVFNMYFNMFIFRVLAPKFGKFRPWVLIGSLPMIAIILLLGFLPLNEYDYSKRLWVINLIFSFFNMFNAFTSQKTNILNRMSPSSQERTTISVIVEFVQGLIGSITMVGLPLLTVYTGGLTNINTYRYLIPALVLVFTPLLLMMVFGVKDRVIQEKEHVVSVSITKGFKQVIKNKYLWIQNIHGLANNIMAGYIEILDVMVVYSLRQDYLLGVLTSVAGGFATVGLIFVPYVIKKLGKKKTNIISSFLQIISFGLQIVGIYTNNLIILFIGIGSVNLFNVFTCKSYDLMTPDIWDYQQYISGERLEASMGIFGLVLSPIAKAFALIIPTVYALVGFTSDWGVMYFEDVRMKVFMYTAIIIMTARILACVPFFFYDLSEKRHAEIIEELKRRAGQLPAKEEEKEDEPTISVQTDIEDEPKLALATPACIRSFHSETELEEYLNSDTAKGKRIHIVRRKKLADKE